MADDVPQFSNVVNVRKNCDKINLMKVYNIFVAHLVRTFTKTFSLARHLESLVSFEISSSFGN